MFLSLLLCSGCVSQGKYDEIRTQNLELSKRVQALEQKNEALGKELDVYSQASNYFFTAGMDFYGQKKYDEALDAFEKLGDRFPTSPLLPKAEEKVAEIKNVSAGNLRDVLKSLEGLRDPKAKIDLIHRELKEKYFTKEHLAVLQERRAKIAQDLQSEAETQTSLSRYIMVEDDQTRSTRFYRTTRPVLQQVGYDKKFYVELYAAQKYSGKKSFRLKTRFSAPDYLSYETVVLQRDNGTRLEITCKYPRKQTSVDSDGVNEWSDDEIADEEKVFRLARSSSISVQFKGGYRYTFEMNEEQAAAFREVVKRYQGLKAPEKTPNSR